MRNTGEDIINSICKRLADKNELCTDANIVNSIRKLHFYELNQLVSFGDVTKWHNDREESDE